MVAGIGVPQITAVREVSNVLKKKGVKIEVWACDISYKEIKLSHSIKVI